MAAEITPKKSATLAAKTDKAGDAEVEQAAERANDLLTAKKQSQAVARPHQTNLDRAQEKNWWDRAFCNCFQVPDESLAPPRPSAPDPVVASAPDPVVASAAQASGEMHRTAVEGGLEALPGLQAQQEPRPRKEERSRRGG